MSQVLTRRRCIRVSARAEEKKCKMAANAFPLQEEPKVENGSKCFVNFAYILE